MANFDFQQSAPTIQELLNSIPDKAEQTEVEQLQSDVETLRALYEALQQSAPVIIQPSDTWPVASPSEGVIYRVIDRANTPPQYYSDYMWNGTAMVLMATYDNAIDDVPTAGSDNLVKSGGVEASFRPLNHSNFYFVSRNFRAGEKGGFGEIGTNNILSNLFANPLSGFTVSVNSGFVVKINIYDSQYNCISQYTENDNSITVAANAWSERLLQIQIYKSDSSDFKESDAGISSTLPFVTDRTKTFTTQLDNISDRRLIYLQSGIKNGIKSLSSNNAVILNQLVNSGESTIGVSNKLTIGNVSEIKGKYIKGVFLHKLFGASLNIFKETVTFSDANHYTTIESEMIYNLTPDIDGYVYVPLEVQLSENQIITFSGISSYTYFNSNLGVSYFDNGVKGSSLITLNISVLFINRDISLKSSEKLIMPLRQKGSGAVLFSGSTSIIIPQEKYDGRFIKDAYICGTSGSVIEFYDVSISKDNFYADNFVADFSNLIKQVTLNNNGENVIPLCYQLCNSHTIGIKLISGSIIGGNYNILPEKYRYIGGTSSEFTMNKFIAYSYYEYAMDKGKWKGLYHSPSFGFSVSITNTNTIIYGGLMMDAIRCNGVKGFYLFAQNTGTLTVLKVSNITSYAEQTLEEITISQKGFQFVSLSDAQTFSENEYLGIRASFGINTCWATNVWRKTCVLQERFINWYYIYDGNTVSQNTTYGAITIVPYYDEKIRYIESDIENANPSFSKFCGKRISIIGDSISTFSGFIKEGNASWYPNGDVQAVEKMWWCILQRENEVLIGTVDAYSGSAIRKGSTYSVIDNQRWLNAVCPDGKSPDVVICFIGTNDFPYANIGTEEFIMNNTDVALQNFKQALIRMLYMIGDTVPSAEIFLCTVTPRNGESLPEVSSTNGLTIYQFAQVMIDCANYVGAKLIDLSNICSILSWSANTDKNIYSIDGLHPNEKGQELIYKKICDMS